MSQSQTFIDKWKGVVQAKSSPGNRVDYLIDGWATFNRMYDAILTTLSGDCEKYYIYFLGWWLDDDLLLRPKDSETGKEEDPSSSFIDLMRLVSRKKVEIRVMIWANPFKVGEPLQMKHVNALAYGAGIVDDNNLRFQSHHQKLLVINGNEGLVGFCGGIDIAKDRVQSISLHKGSPFHDVHCRIQGDAVIDLLDVFRQRWKSSPRVMQLDEKKRSLRAPEQASSSRVNIGEQYVGILRTFLPAQKRCIAEASIGTTILKAIRTAERFIYVEDQYMVNAWAPYTDGADKNKDLAFVASALGERLDKLQHITILIPHSAISDLPRIWEARRIFAEMIFQKAGKAGVEERKRYINALLQEPGTSAKTPYPKLRIFFKYETPEKGSPRDREPGYRYEPEDFGPGSYVHAKVWIFDDELAIIGSANCNRRGWNYDSEVAAAIFDRAPSNNDENFSFAQQLRIKLWAKHLRLASQEELIVDGVKGKDSWLTKDASKYVRLYNPGENTDPVGLGSAKNSSQGGERNPYNFLADPGFAKIPVCVTR